MRRLALLASLFAALAGCERDASEARPAPRDFIAHTEAGQVEGRARGDVVVYRGIPYAAAPVGALRFSPPRPPPPWSGVRDATRFGPKCPQMTLGGGFVGDEDCLSVNVWRPRADPPAGGYPVLVVVHGGSNVIGSGAEPHLDGRVLATEHGLVVVTFNYRLGLLGFLALPELRAQHGTAGNWAHLDQIAALRWVAHNIASFGGDPEAVTVMGHSAGALSVCVLLASPLAKGLIDAAILQSGSCDVAPMQLRERQGDRLLRTSHCDEAEDPLACARALTPPQIVALTPPPTNGTLAANPRAGGVANWALPVGGAIDGRVLPRSPFAIFAAAEHSVVPTLVGSAADETELFTPSSLDSCDAYATAIATHFGEAAPRILTRYPCPADAGARQTYVTATTDALFGCHARRILAALGPAAARANTPLFRYRYAHVRQDPAVRELRAFHGGELQLLTGTHDRLGYAVPDPERELAAAMRASWAALATAGSPVTAATPGWAAYDLRRDNAVVFAWPIEVVEPLDRPRCGLWDAIAAP